MLRVSFLGGSREVGRSCILVEEGKKKLLLDAGIKLGVRGKERYPLIRKNEIRKLDAVIVTHAHLDHSGYVPFLVKNGFKGKIYCTKATRDLMHLLLSDAMKIAKEKGERIYSEKDLRRAMRQIKTFECGIEREIVKGVKLEFFNAGHILGAVQVLLSFSRRNGVERLLYSGDINTRESNLLDRVEIPRKKIDYLIMESTYSGKEDTLPSLQKASKELADVVRETLKRGGKVLIPTFGVGRGQEIMFVLENYARSGYLPELSIYCDGMINKANRIYRHNVIYLKIEIPKRILLADEDPFKSVFLKIPMRRDKSDVLGEKNAVILATSGMLTGGPSVGYFKRLAGSGENCIVVVGYQAEGTLGRELVEGKKEVEIRGEKVRVNCNIENVSFSGHADYTGLGEYAKGVGAKEIFVVHGEKGKSFEFADLLERKLGKGRRTKVFVPENDELFELG